MLDWLEAWLAKWTGKSQWPSVRGRVESHLAIPDGQIRNPRSARYAILSYEVGGETYLASIREMWGQSARPAHKGGSVTIQYNLEKPSDYYFAPACKLAGRCVVGLVVLIGAIAIVILIRTAN